MFDSFGSSPKPTGPSPSDFKDVEELAKQQQKYNFKDQFADQGAPLAAALLAFKNQLLKEMDKIGLNDQAIMEQAQQICSEMEDNLKKHFETVVKGGTNEEVKWQEIVEQAKTKLLSTLGNPGTPEEEKFVNEQIQRLNYIKDEAIKDQMYSLKRSMESQQTNTDAYILHRKMLAELDQIGYGRILDNRLGRQTQDLWQATDEAKINPADFPDLESEDGVIALGAGRTGVDEEKVRRFLTGENRFWKNPNSLNTIEYDHKKGTVTPKIHKNSNFEQAYSEAIDFAMAKLKKTHLTFNYDHPSRQLNNPAQMKKLKTLMLMTLNKGGIPELPQNVIDHLEELKLKTNDSTKREEIAEILALRNFAKDDVPKMRKRTTEVLDGMKASTFERRSLEEKIASQAAPATLEQKTDKAMEEIMKFNDNPAPTNEAKVDAIQAELEKIKIRAEKLNAARAEISGQLTKMNEMADRYPTMEFLQADPASAKTQMSRLNAVQTEMNAELADLNRRRDALQRVYDNTDKTNVPAAKQDKVTADLAARRADLTAGANTQVELDTYMNNHSVHQNAAPARRI